MLNINKNNNNNNNEGITISTLLIKSRQDILKLDDDVKENVNLYGLLLSEFNTFIISFKNILNNKIEIVVKDTFENAVEFILNTNKENEIIINTDYNIFKNLEENKSLGNLKVNINKELKIFFKPIEKKLIKCFLIYIYGKNISDGQIGEFALKLYPNSRIFNFIHTEGIAHSAQDIITFIKTGLPLDMVYADSLNHVEIFTLCRSENTTKIIDPLDLSLTYFPIYQQYKDVSRSLASKFAVIDCCIKFNINFGYSCNLIINKNE